MRNEYIELCLILSTLVYNDLEYLNQMKEVKNLRFVKKCLEWNRNNINEVIPINSTFITYSIVDDILFISIAGTITNKQLVKHWYGFLSRINELDKYCTGDYYYHTNFLNNFNTIKENFYKIIENNSNKRIIFSGHSVGGSVGLLCALITKLKYPNRIVEFVSFGTPSGCCHKTSELVNNTLNECIQFKHKYDYVPKLALRSLFGRAGKSIILNEIFDTSKSKSYYFYHKLETYFNCIIFDNQDTNE